MLASSVQQSDYIQGFPSGSVLKNLPAKQKMRAQSLGREDLLEKEMASHSSIFAWEIPWTEKCGRLPPMELQKTQLSNKKNSNNIYMCVCVCIFSKNSLDSFPLFGVYTVNFKMFVVYNASLLSTCFIYSANTLG